METKMQNSRDSQMYLERSEDEDKTTVTYLWLDEHNSFKLKLRSVEKIKCQKLRKIPPWTFSQELNSEILLTPVARYKDPFNRQNGLLVFCKMTDSALLENNCRDKLQSTYKKVRKLEPSIQIKQEFVLFRNEWKLSKLIKWDKETNEDKRSIGREVLFSHYQACMFAGIRLNGSFNEFLEYKWSFETGIGDPLKICDDLWVARFILMKILDKFIIKFKLNWMPMRDIFSNCRIHFSFSTSATRKPNGVMQLKSFVSKMKMDHEYFAKAYNTNKSKQTGKLNKLKKDFEQRKDNIEIPNHVLNDECGYLVDYRAVSDCDPYAVVHKIISYCLLPTVLKKIEAELKKCGHKLENIDCKQQNESSDRKVAKNNFNNILICN